MIKGAIFDVDGTILDTMPMWDGVGELYLKKKGIEAQPDLSEALFKMTVTEGASYMKETYKLEESVKEIIDGTMEVARVFYEEEAPLKAGVRETLQILEENHVEMAVATASDIGCIKKAFERLGISKYFKHMVSCEEFGVGKEDPIVFYKTVELLGTPIEDTYVFEDALHAIETAKKVGFGTVGIYDDSSKKQWEQIQKTADISVNSLEEFSIEKIKKVHKEERKMSEVEKILEYNKQFVANKEYEKFTTSKYPDKKIAILTCMDTRLVELLPAALGIKNGDVKMIKNAGGMITNPFGSVVRSFLVAIIELGVEEIMVIGHTDCGVAGMDADEMIEHLKKRGISQDHIDMMDYCGIDFKSWLSGFENVEQSVADAVELLRNHPLMPKDVSISGFVINTQTGELIPQ